VLLFLLQGHFGPFFTLVKVTGGVFGVTGEAPFGQLFLFP